MKILPNFFRTDLSEHAEFLSSLQLGEQEGDAALELELIMSNEDTKSGRGLWTYDTADSRYSLQGAIVFYNGVNDTMFPTNPLFTHVVGITLKQYADEEQGRVYLHYNAS